MPRRRPLLALAAALILWIGAVPVAGAAAPPDPIPEPGDPTAPPVAEPPDLVVDGSAPAVAPAGPALTVPADQLAAALACTGDLEGADRPPVLLIHGTALDVETNFSWNYTDSFDRLGWPYCTLDLPNFALGDIQDNAEYVVHAIREMADRSDRTIQILGFSQGGMVPRWAFRFWPDTRDLVQDLVSLAGSHRGTLSAIPVCLLPCPPAVWQQAATSDFIRVLNSGPMTYPEIDYTSVYTRTDPIVFPNITPPFAFSVLDGGDNVANVAVQDVCPLRFPEHLLLGTSNPVGYALAIDALSNDGPADRRRVSRAVCLRPYMPDVTTAEFAVRFPEVVALAGANLAFGQPRVPAEPPLRPYAEAALAGATP